jgi:hypothetical protein
MTNIVCMRILRFVNMHVTEAYHCPLGNFGQHVWLGLVETGEKHLRCMDRRGAHLALCHFLCFARSHD